MCGVFFTENLNPNGDKKFLFDTSVVLKLIMPPDVFRQKKEGRIAALFKYPSSGI
jgi:hypothetical protein